MGGVEASSFLIGIGDLEPGVRRDVRIEAPADWAVATSKAAGPIVADLALHAHSGGVMVTGSAAAEFTHTCNRCLTDYTATLSVRIAEDFLSGDGGDYVVVDDTIDTEPMLRDELLLAVPLVPRCRDDCRGLCPECGTDLNTHACSGHETESVSPFAELRSLFDQE
jgi:uncharacterized protein